MSHGLQVKSREVRIGRGVCETSLFLKRRRSEIETETKTGMAAVLSQEKEEEIVEVVREDRRASRSAMVACSGVLRKRRCPGLERLSA